MPHSIIKIKTPELNIETIRAHVARAINPFEAQIHINFIYPACRQLGLKRDWCDIFETPHVELLGKSFPLVSYSLDGRSMEDFSIIVPDVADLCNVLAEIQTRGVDVVESKISIDILHNKQP